MVVRYGDEWGEEDVKDALMQLAGENRYHLRHDDRSGKGINARTGIPLE
jgi:hypothetical protein